MSVESTDRPRHSAWREPMVWLVWGLPSLVVVAGIATLVIALRAGGSDTTPAEVRRTAQIQVEDLEADRAALARGLRGELRIQADTGAVQVVLDAVSGEDVPVLQLQLRHPGRADRDETLALVAANGAWHGRLAPRAQAWNLELSPPDRAWRLGGRLERGATTASLAPRLAD